MDDVIALAVQVVLQALDSPLVPGDDRGREDDGVVLLELDEAMIIGNDARKSGILLALGTSTDDHDLIVRILMDVVYGNEGLFLGFEVTQFLGYFDIHLHAVAFQSHALAHTFGIFDQVGDTAHLGCESSDDDTARGFTNEVLEVGVHFGFRRRKSLLQSAKRFEHQEGRLRKGFEVGIGDIALDRIDRLMADHPVSEMDNRTARCYEGDTHSVHDRVLDIEEAHSKTPSLMRSWSDFTRIILRLLPAPFCSSSTLRWRSARVKSRPMMVGYLSCFKRIGAAPI